MSRALRRAAERAQRRNPQPNRSAARYITHFQREHESFDTIERMFQQIRHGELRYDPQEGWVIMGLAGEDLHILSALEGWILYWETLTDDQGIAYEDSALRRLARSLEYEKPLNEAEVTAAYAVVQLQRSLYRTLPKTITTRVSHEVSARIRRDNEIRERMGAQT
jgi:hypothetical protein